MVECSHIYDYTCVQFTSRVATMLEKFLATPFLAAHRHYIIREKVTVS